MVVDEFARICDNRKIQVLSLRRQKEITEWSGWSSCSVSCGRPVADETFTGGIRTRKRVKIIHEFVPGNGVFEPGYSTQDEDTEVETETCHNFACRKFPIFFVAIFFLHFGVKMSTFFLFSRFSNFLETNSEKTEVSDIEILSKNVQNLTFSQKLKFGSKIGRNFGRKLKFWSKIEILVEN